MSFVGTMGGNSLSARERMSSTAFELALGLSLAFLPDSHSSFDYLTLLLDLLGLSSLVF